jgi:hypothetical protein
MVIVALPLQALMFFTILASLDGVYKLHVGLVTPPKGCLLMLQMYPVLHLMC